MFVRHWIRSVPGWKLVAQTRREVMEVDLVAELVTELWTSGKPSRVVPHRHSWPCREGSGTSRYQHRWELPLRN